MVAAAKEHIVWAYPYAGRCGDAVEWLAQAIALDPGRAAAAATDPAFAGCQTDPA